MNTLQEQIKNFNEMKNSKQRQKEFNDRMVNLTWKYQKIYKFQTRDKREMNFGIMKQMLLNIHLEVH